MERKRFPIFSERFAELRGEKTQAEFADFLGISRPTVGFYENGTRIPDALVLCQIAERCNVSADWLLGLSEERTTDSDVQKVCQYTGLSSWTIEFLHNLQDPRKRNFYKRLLSEFTANMEIADMVPEGIFEAARAHIIAERESKYDSVKQKSLNNFFTTISSDGHIYTITPDDAEDFYFYRAQAVLRNAVDIVIEELLLECEDACKDIETLDSFEWAVEDENTEEGITWNI